MKLFNRVKHIVQIQQAGTVQSDSKLHKKKVNHAPVIIEKCGCGGPMQLHPPHPLETHLSTDIISDDKPRLIGSTKSGLSNKYTAPCLFPRVQRWLLNQFTVRPCRSVLRKMHFL